MSPRLLISLPRVSAMVSADLHFSGSVFPHLVCRKGMDEDERIILQRLFVEWNRVWGSLGKEGWPMFRYYVLELGVAHSICHVT